MIIRKPFCNSVDLFQLCCNYYVSGASVFVGLITGSKCPETNNFLLKFVSLFLFWEMKTIPCEKLPPETEDLVLCRVLLPSQNSINGTLGRVLTSVSTVTVLTSVSTVTVLTSVSTVTVLTSVSTVTVLTSVSTVTSTLLLPLSLNFCTKCWEKSAFCSYGTFLGSFTSAHETLLHVAFIFLFSVDIYIYIYIYIYEYKN